MEYGEMHAFNMPETEKPDARVVRLADGLGYGTGTISHQDRHAEAVNGEVLAQVEAVIEDPTQVLVPVSKDKTGAMIDDDGCGDGRPWAATLTKGDLPVYVIEEIHAQMSQLVPA